MTWALLAASLAIGWQIVRTADGFLLNNYPFLSSDSFDWILEGVYLARALTGAWPERPLPGDGIVRCGRPAATRRRTGPWP